MSGPKSIPMGAAWAFSASCTSPGWTRHQSSSRFTSSTWFMYLEKSMTMAWPTVWPASEVPPPRASTGTRCLLATSMTAWTSPLWRGTTTPTGSTW